jgi:hypothetical protein
MFSTSHDVLLLTISACVAAFTIFLCWGMFYLIGMASNLFKIVKDARRMVDKVEGLIDAIKDKVNSSASYLFLIGEALKKILEVSKEWRGKKEADHECDCECDGEECACEDCAAEEAKEEVKPQKVKVKGK